MWLCRQRQTTAAVVVNGARFDVVLYRPERLLAMRVPVVHEPCTVRASEAIRNQVVVVQEVTLLHRRGVVTVHRFCQGHCVVIPTFQVRGVVVVVLPLVGGGSQVAETVQLVLHVVPVEGAVVLAGPLPLSVLDKVLLVIELHAQ